MKAITEHLIVAVIAIFMAFVGYWLMDKYASLDFGWGRMEWTKESLGWAVWLSVISVLTWLYLYRVCRRLHWLVMPVMGVFSPIIGALLLVIPYLIFPFLVIWMYVPVVFPVGIVTGFLISAATLPFRPQKILRGNA
ncbi:hypothetical protein WJU23_22210 [Prosthecobacter sp. SYSU 5D2]|uniref:hypothetical protein n=1 Tax=Prosthecobacter sp. SYSU 5D2 TaxID=3134134 RepID=UPI0031FEBAB9